MGDSELHKGVREECESVGHLVQPAQRRRGNSVWRTASHRGTFCSVLCGIRGGRNAVEEDNLLRSDSSSIYPSRLPVLGNISKSQDYHSHPDDKMAFTYERIDKNNVALLVVDHQEGLFQMCRDRTPQEMKSSVLAHAELAKVFNLPTILTTSAETGKIQTRGQVDERRTLTRLFGFGLQDRTAPCPRRS